ncbi:MAG: hypothetical protein ACREBR_02565 [bacterium]
MTSLHPNRAHKYEWTFDNAITQPPAVQGYACVSLLTIIEDEEFQGFKTSGGKRLRSFEKLFLKPVSEAWRDNVHLPPLLSDAANWMLTNERRCRRDPAYDRYPTRFSSAFFYSCCFEAFRTGRWRIYQEIEKEEIHNFFTVYSFILTIHGRNYPPQYPAQGFTCTEMRDILANIMWIFDLALTDHRSGLPSAFHQHSLIGRRICRLYEVLGFRMLSDQWSGSHAAQLRHTHTVFFYVNRLFQHFWEWMSYGQKVFLVNPEGSSRSDVRAVTPFLSGGYSDEAIYDRLREWDRNIEIAFRENYTREPDLHIGSPIPEFLIESPVAPEQRISFQQAVAKSTSKQAPRQQAKEAKGKTPCTYRKARACLFQWAPSASHEEKKRPIARILVSAGDRMRIPKIHIRTSGSETIEKQVCFHFTFADGQGCDGTMRIGSTVRPCNRVELDMQADDWKSYTATDLAPLVKYLKHPEIKRYFSPTDAFAASDIWKGSS